jgi:hypothetical protein
MALAGKAKGEYQRDYMRRRRNAAKPCVATCSFCGEAGSSDRLLVGDEDCANLRGVHHLGGRQDRRGARARGLVPRSNL